MLKGRTGGGRFQNLGYLSEIDYWKHLGGTGDTIVDCMVSYLGGLGYTGTPQDQLNAWLQAQKSKGFINDNARALTGE